MDETRRTLTRAVVLVALSAVVGAAVHFPLARRFARGEFRESFFQASDYAGVRMITLAEAEELWAAGEAVVLDARAEEFFARGHVPGARNVPTAEAEGLLPAGLLAIDRERTLVVYCEGGACQSSLSLAKRLNSAGFRDVRVFGGGWDAWKAAGLPEETGDGQA